uniref:Uncharacterized protein n=1 Tax=Anguilla anguilla TaxID=7936 RepID=A0A0E9S177_ANGAN
MRESIYFKPDILTTHILQNKSTMKVNPQKWKWPFPSSSRNSS